uniref:Uncharacterized protein n=1 Tax=Rhizophora mucronata TaxID=61149 RepID=A0A2P2JUD6_RHIMU
MKMNFYPDKNITNSPCHPSNNWITLEK